MGGDASTGRHGRPLRFGPGGRFELRPAEFRLLVDGRPAVVGGRALDLLIALAARPREVVTKNELLDTVWRGLVVEENNLRVQVNALRKLLGEDAIATVPGRGYRLGVALEVEADPPASDAVVPHDNARAADDGSAPRLFGRDEDLARVAASLRKAGRCTTLVGTPGVGKSSVAREAARRWPARVAWVDLGPLADTGPLGGAIARALGTRLDAGDAIAQVLEALPRDEAPLLLVLDNAEHLVDGCATLATRLREATSLRLLVTSQVPLAVEGEAVLRVEPLPVPDDATLRDAAVAMLVDRIVAADARFRATPDALPVLRALCRQLDGLPLALEMAAARVPLMGLRAVHDALAERFALLSRGRRDSPARHRTLHDALAWSYGLLAPFEQRLYRALGVFAGGFTLDLAVTQNADEHVGRWDIVDGLATLVERSLVGVSGDDPPRYRLLETMRAHALELLAASAAEAGEGLSARRRHAAAILGLLARGDAEAECLAEMENVREAFRWSREHDLALAVQLSTRVARVIGFTAWRQDVTDWMLSLRPVMHDGDGRALPLRVQAAWWSMLTYVLQVRRDPQARAAATTAVAMWRDLDDPAELQSALADLVRTLAEPGDALDRACDALQASAAKGFTSPRAELRVHGALAEAARVRRDHATLLACRERELALAREIGWRDMAQAAETNICAALIELHRHAEAAARARALVERIDHDPAGPNANLAWALYMLGEALLPLRAFDEARALVPRLLDAERRFGTGIAWRWILMLVDAQGHVHAAARLLGHVGEARYARKDATDPDEDKLLDRIAATVRTRLGRERADALIAEGRSLDAAAAAAIAARATDEV